MAMTLRALVGLVLALASGCAARRERLADPEPDRERSVILADGVSVRATLWDRMLVARAADLGEAELAPLGTSAGRSGRRDRVDRLHARYADGVVFTVLVELAHRTGTDDPLADPTSWWFDLQRGGQRIPARSVEVLAIDRFPTGSVRAGAVSTVHLRIALRVAFDGESVDDGRVTMRLGNRAKHKRRYSLGSHIARHGSMLRWAATDPR
jgi:hypothetical protein